jgi:hypothetical protein
LAEVKKGYPQMAPDVIRAVLPPLPKGTEPKPATRKPRVAKPAQTTAKPAAARTRQAPAKGKAQPKPATNDGTTDKERLALARKVVALRDKDGLSWLKIGAALKLAEGAGTPKAGAAGRARCTGWSRARTPAPACSRSRRLNYQAPGNPPRRRYV